MITKIFFTTLFSLTLFVSSCNAEVVSSEKDVEINPTDKEIETLETQLKELRKNAFNKEMNAQPYMFDNWSEYTEKINENENDEKQILEIKSKIEHLKSSKNTLQTPHN